MNYVVSAVFFLVASFIFAICWAVTSFMLDEIATAMGGFAAGMPAADTISLLSWAFGIFCVLFLLVGIVLIFILESMRDEPEYYYQ